MVLWRSADVEASMNRRLQFSLAALFGIITLSALPAHVLGLQRRQAEAENALETTLSEYNTGKKTDEDVYRASVACLRAALRVPFGDHKAAHAKHLERMSKMERHARFLGCGTVNNLEQLLRAIKKRGATRSTSGSKRRSAGSMKPREPTDFLGKLTTSG